MKRCRVHRSRTGEGSLKAVRARTAAVGVVEEIPVLVGTFGTDGTRTSYLMKKRTDSYVRILTNGELINGHAGNVSLG